ncbi:MAG: Gfo/Idh/MocA family protein [Gaiella sp.]
MRVGLVGCGRWGVNILRDLRALGCDVPVVARSSLSVARARAGGAEEIVPSVSQLAGCDGVVVATPTSTHAGVIEQSLALGVPVFTEKPLCDDPGAARSLAEAAAHRLFVMDKWRYHPGVLALAAVSRSGELGRVLGLRTSRLGWGTRHDDVDSTWVLMPHDLSIALEILGQVPAPISAVGASTSAGTTLTGLLRFGDVWQVLEISDRSPVWRRRIELVCEAGVAVLDGGWSEHVDVVRTGGDEPDETTLPTAGELPLLAELRAFVEHLDGGPAPRSSAGEGALIVEHIAELRRLARLE